MRNYDDDGARNPKLCPERSSPNITNYDTVIIIGARVALFFYSNLHFKKWIKKPI